MVSDTLSLVWPNVFLDGAGRLTLSQDPHSVGELPPSLRGPGHVGGGTSLSEHLGETPRQLAPMLFVPSSLGPAVIASSPIINRNLRLPCSVEPH